MKAKPEHIVKRYEYEMRKSDWMQKLRDSRLSGFNFEKQIRLLKAKINKTPKAIEIIQEFSFSDKRILILSSPPGTGKTFASAFYLYLAWKKSLALGLEDWSFLFLQEKELFGVSSLPDDKKAEYIDRAKRVQFLVIDDFGQVSPHGFLADVMKLFYEDIFDRRRKMKPAKGMKAPRLILTTNLKLSEIQKLPYFSERIQSRMKAITIFREFTDIDYRQFGLPDFLSSY